MSAARSTAKQRHRLALVQGGRSHAETGDGDAGWDDFCHRIGWQGPAPEPDDDFERRLAEGLFSKPIEEDNVVDLDLARAAAGAQSPDARADLGRSGTHAIEEALLRELRQALVREASPPVSERRPLIWRDAEERDALDLEDERSRPGLSLASPRWGDAAALAGLAPEAERKPGRWARVALTLALAAGAVLAITRLTASDRSPSASIPLVAAESALAATAEPRMDDGARSEAQTPPEAAPVRPAPPEQPTARPAPGPRIRAVAPQAPKDASSEPPGAVASRREPEAPARGRASALGRPASPGARGVDLARGEPLPGNAFDTGGWVAAGASADRPAPWIAAAHYPFTVSSGMGMARAPSRLFHSTATVAAPDPVRGPAPQTPFADVWSKGSSAEAGAYADRTRPAYASWSLSGEKNRWVGASLTPLPFDVRPNVGVTVQLDLGEALNKL